MVKLDKKTLMNQVHALYLSYGIKSVTMDDVARGLGISKKTLYQHVSSKHDLVEQVFRYEVDEKQCDFTQVFREDAHAIDELLAVMRLLVKTMRAHNPATVYDLQKYYPELFRELKQKQREYIYQALKKNMEKGISQGLFRKELNVGFVARMQVSMVEAMLELPVINQKEIFEPELIFESANYHIRGIINRTGLDYLEKLLSETPINAILYEQGE